MSHRFSELTFTPAVLAMQKQQGTYEQSNKVRQRLPDFDRITEREQAFIEHCDSFFMATVTEDGWPYIQHRGGDKGFLTVVSETVLAFPNYAGNGQYQSLGNLSKNRKTALFLVDYPARRRLKILGHASLHKLDALPDNLKGFELLGRSSTIESILMFEVEAYDWNCPKYITPRYTAAEFAQLTGE